MAKSVVQKGEDWVSDKYQKAKAFVKEDVDAWKSILSSPPPTDDTSSQDTSKSPDMGPNGNVWASGHKKGGVIRGGGKMARGGKVSSASSRADGCATKGKTRGRIV